MEVEVVQVSVGSSVGQLSAWSEKMMHVYLRTKLEVVLLDVGKQVEIWEEVGV